MPVKSGGDAVVEALVAHGVDTLFCLPGVQSDHLFNAIFDANGALTPVHTRHEQGAAYMALGAAMATGRPSAYSVVPGPGFLNSCAALATAWAVNAPVMALIGQLPSTGIGKGWGLLHENSRPDRHSLAVDQVRGPHRRAARSATQDRRGLSRPHLWPAASGGDRTARRHAAQQG